MPMYSRQTSVRYRLSLEESQRSYCPATYHRHGNCATLHYGYSKSTVRHMLYGTVIVMSVCNVDVFWPNVGWIKMPLRTPWPRRYYVSWGSTQLPLDRGTEAPALHALFDPCPLSPNGRPSELLMSSYRPIVLCELIEKLAKRCLSCTSMSSTSTS